eukprot:6568627-Alexandrium_andersonii.AAC.1
MAVAARGREGPAPTAVRAWLQENDVAVPATAEEWAHCLVAWRTVRRLQQHVRLKRRARGPTAARDPLATHW